MFVSKLTLLRNEVCRNRIKLFFSCLHVDETQRIGRIQDADVAPRVQDAQVFIAGDDEAGVRSERTGEHRIIVGIAAHPGSQLASRNELCEAAIVGNQLFSRFSGARDVIRMLLAL